MSIFELNMDGLIGPTHHYGGLAQGNLASENNAHHISSPKNAALQGIQKMRLLHKLGLKQAVLPPHERPNLSLLHQLGFCGTPAHQISQAAKTAPEFLSICYSASAMWTANAATVSPSIDSLDGRVHFTAANLAQHLHRQQESSFTHEILKIIFSSSEYFKHHPVLPSCGTLGDEGAANHSRLCEKYGTQGIHFFVYGKSYSYTDVLTPAPIRFTARQTLEASRIVAYNHQIPPDRLIFACQNPIAIDAGVFHNDVIAVANESVLLLHEDAFLNHTAVLEELKRKAPFLNIIELKNSELNLTDAVATYLFNSQLVTLPKGNMALIAPRECEIHESSRQIIHDILKSRSNPIQEVHFTDLKQSMRNGGGPACLRLRVPLNEKELSAMHAGVLASDSLFDSLEIWVNKHYRDELSPSDLADPAFLNESLSALDELSGILNLGSVYPFQREKNLK